MATRRLGDIPVLSGAGVLGHAAELRRDMRGLFARFNRECGEIGFVNRPGTHVLVVHSPALIAEAFVEKAAGFRQPRFLRVALAPLAG